MCGIFGCISNKELDLNNGLNSIRHRGPDNTGRLKTKLNNTNITFGHNRLSILDLSSAGNQPMSTADECITIIFNGEIYNFRNLRRQHLQDKIFNLFCNSTLFP